jgi:hypothetical protein
VAGEIARFFVTLGARDAGLQRSLTTTQRELGGLGAAATRLVPQLGAVENALRLGLAGAAVLGAGQLVRMGVEMAQAGAQAERLGMAFATVWGGLGESSEVALARLRRASRGTISDMDLMLAANRAALLGVATSAEQLGTLMEIAAFRGRALGRTMTEAFNDIVTGIGRTSPLILDNLGIVIDQAAANEEYARSLGRTANSLSEAEKKQALLNAVLRTGKAEIEAAGGIAEDSADQFDQLRVAIENLRRQKALEIADIVAPEAQGMARQISLLSVTNAQLVAGTKSLTEYREAYRQVREEIRQSALATLLTPILSLGPELTTGQWMALKAGAAAAGDEIDVLHNRTLAYTQAARYGLLNVTSEVEGLADAMAELNSVTTMTLLGLGQELGGEVTYAMQRVAEAVVAGNISLADGVLLWNDYRNAYANFLAFVAGNSPEGIVDPESLLITTVGLVTERENLINRLGLNPQRVRSGISDAQRAAEQAARELQGVIEGVLRPTFTGDPANILDSLGLHIDTADEDARRLASVMAEGLSSEWTQYFASRGLLSPDDLISDDAVRGRAATLLREFQLGLRPELVDKETAKQRVREILLGRERTEQLVNEIMAELGAEGVRASRQQIRLALGDTASVGDAGPQAVSVSVAPVTVQATVQMQSLTAGAVAEWRQAAQALFSADAAKLTAGVLLGNVTTDERQGWRNDATNILFDAHPILGYPSDGQKAFWRTQALGIEFNATPNLGDVTADEKQGWRNRATGFIFDAAPLLWAPIQQEKDDWRAAALGIVFDATPNLSANITADEKQGWRNDALGIIFDATPNLQQPTADEKQGWRNDALGIVFDATPNAEGFTEKLGLALGVDLTAHYTDQIRPIAEAVAQTFAADLNSSFGGMGYVSALSEAITNDFVANKEPLTVIAKAMGQYVGVILTAEAKKNINIVQGVIDAAIEQMAAGLIEQAQQEGQ